MSALATILMAAMAVSGDGPEKVSGETVETLDLSGEWEGTGRTISESEARIKISRGCVDIQSQNGAISLALKAIDEGEGKLRLEAGDLGTVRRSLGIYKWQGDHLIICCREEKKGRPTSFMDDEGSSLLILHRAKPRK